MGTATPKVSVVIRCKNADWIIRETLSALFSQEFRDFELVVVDSGSTDRTLAIVGDFPCRLVHMDPGSYYSGTALNLGIESAQADLLVFLNSDTVPLHPHVLGRLVAAFDDPEVQAAFCRQVPRPDAWTWVRHEVAAAFPDAETPPPWITYTVPMAAMRRSIWQIHPFFTAAWGSEDTEWGYWATRNGVKIRYLADAQVMHSHNHDLGQLYGRLYTEGEAMALIYEDRTESVLNTARRFLGDCARDLRDHLTAGDLAGMPQAPVRRAVCRWAYYKGHKLGERRRRTGDRDGSAGQRVILARYEGRGAKGGS